MTLLDDVIDQASDGDASAMLRKLMIVAHRLGAEALLGWVKGELNGYDDADSIPDYRGPLDVSVQAVIVGPGGGKGTNTLSQHGMPDGFDALFKVWFTDPLAVLEGFASSRKGISVPWDPTVVGLYNGWINDGSVPFIPYWGVYSAHKSVSQASLRGIVDVVRTKALELALDLQREFPEAGEKEGPTVANPEVREAVTLITNNIYGSVTGLAQGHNVEQTVSVTAGDLVGALSSAKKFLEQEGIIQLSAVLTQEGTDADKRGRLEKLIGGVRAGSVALATGVTTDLAASGLMDIASQFFGW